MLTLILFFLATFTVRSAPCLFLSEPTSFSCQKTSREAAINQLAKQNNISLSYPSGCFGDDLVTISVTNKSIFSVLQIILGKVPIAFRCVGDRSLVFYHQPGLPFLLAGSVIDQQSRMPVSGAVVVHKERWTETDADGNFVVEINTIPTEITLYYPGFESNTLNIDRAYGTEELVVVDLIPDATLSEAVVNLFDSLMFVNKTGGANINMKEIEKIPSISGSPGILNSLRLIPGLQSTIEVNGGMMVRGGSKDQNLVLFDGMDLYNPMHLFGLFSVFGQGSIQSIEFYKNSYPAAFGGRLSSVLNVHSKQGDYKNWNATLDFNPVLFEATFNGPIKKDKTSLLVSGRRSFTDFFPLFYEQIQNQNQLSRFKYFFYDVTSTLNHRFSDKSSLSFTNYIGGDKGYIRSKTQLAGATTITEESNDAFLQSNLLSTLSWKIWLSSAFQMQALVGYTEYQFSHDNSYDLSIAESTGTYIRQSALSYQSKISDWKTGAYFNSTANPEHVVKFGLENIWHQLNPSSSGYFLRENDVLYDTLFEQRNSEITEQRFFLQSHLNKGGFRILTGLHFANFDNEVSYHSLQPRLNISYEGFAKNKMEIGFARTTQFILSVPNNLLGIPIDIWVPADSAILPQYCWNLSLGFARQLGKNLIFRADAYYKNFENVVEFKSGVLDFVAEWDKALLTGKSRSKGVELLLKKEKGPVNGWLGYMLSKTERSIDEINDGAWFPFQFDRRHDFTVVLNYQPSDAINIGATWTYASGHYLTAPESQYLITTEGKRYLIQQSTSKNNLKLPAYHRLDVGIHYNKDIGKARQTWSFTVYNAYNQQNVFYVNSSVNNNGNVSFHPISILPILPSINYAIKF